jgi:uncharacterized membrane protein
VWIKLKENFTDHEFFYIYASDGKLSDKSNKIYVFEEMVGANNNGTNLTNGSLLTGVYRGGNISFGGNTSGNKTGGLFGVSSLGWLFWLLGGGVFLGIIGVLIYFALQNNPIKPEIVGPSPQVEEYLKEVTGFKEKQVLKSEDTKQI